MWGKEDPKGIKEVASHRIHISFKLWSKTSLLPSILLMRGASTEINGIILLYVNGLHEKSSEYPAQSLVKGERLNCNVGYTHVNCKVLVTTLCHIYSVM